LQRVLEIRERKEQASAARLADARNAADAARGTETLFAKLRQEGAERRMGMPGSVPTVGQLQNTNYVLQRLDQQLEEARTLVRQADLKVNTCLAEFNVATRDRQVIDRLKERKLEEAMLEEADLDRKTMDAVALTRFFRNGAGNRE
jgi:flagellar export protein FliJ